MTTYRRFAGALVLTLVPHALPAADGLPVSVLPPVTAAATGGGSEPLLPETIAPGTVLAPAPATPSQPLDEVSARLGDALTLDDLALPELPLSASSGDWFSSGLWYGSAEALGFARSRNNRRELGHDVTYKVKPRNLVGTLTTDGLPWNVSPGARVTVGRYLGRDDVDRDRSLEMTYYGGLGFSLSDSWNALPGSYLVSPLTKVPGFDGATTYTTAQTSNFNSVEWNYKLRRRLGRDQVLMAPDGSWERHAERGWLPALLIGTRVATVNESFALDSSRAKVPPSKFSGAYSVQTQNWLWALNLGGELLSQNEFFFWGLRGRAGPAVTFAADQQSVQSVNTVLPAPVFATGSVNRAMAAATTGPGFLGDLTLTAGWNVTPNFALKAGYDFLWVAGIATATRQFDLDNVRNRPIDPGGQIFYNGVSVGCEGSW